MHLIIIGAPRSGKTTLSKILHKEFGFNIISLDDLVQGFTQVFPQIGITEKDETKNSSLLTPFLKIYAKIHTQYSYINIPFIIEGTHLSPEDASSLAKFAHKDFYVVALGFPNLNIEEKIALLKKHDKETDWSYNRSFDELKLDIKNAIEYSKWLEKECKKHKIRFLDTSFDRDTVLDEFISEFSNKL